MEKQISKIYIQHNPDSLLSLILCPTWNPTVRGAANKPFNKPAKLLTPVWNLNFVVQVQEQMHGASSGDVFQCENCRNFKTRNITKNWSSGKELVGAGAKSGKWFKAVQIAKIFWPESWAICKAPISSGKITKGRLRPLAPFKIHFNSKCLLAEKKLLWKRTRQQMAVGWRSVSPKYFEIIEITSIPTSSSRGSKASLSSYLVLLVLHLTNPFLKAQS